MRARTLHLMLGPSPFIVEISYVCMLCGGLYRCAACGICEAGISHTKRGLVGTPSQRVPPPVLPLLVLGEAGAFVREQKICAVSWLVGAPCLRAGHFPPRITGACGHTSRRVFPLVCEAAQWNKGKQASVKAMHFAYV